MLCGGGGREECVSSRFCGAVVVILVGVFCLEFGVSSIIAVGWFGRCFVPYSHVVEPRLGIS